MKTDNLRPSNPCEMLTELACIGEGISEYRLATLPLAPSIQQRATLDVDDLSVVSRALEFREKMNLPFWDGALLEAAGAGRVAVGVLSAAVFHQPLLGHVQWVKPNQLESYFDLDSKGGAGIVAVTSLVKTKADELKHLPMLDFHIPYSDSATKIVIKVLKLLKARGILLKSGKSYHYYGYELLSESSLISFLGQALLFAPILDRNWIAHQLIERCCALRISSRAEYGGPPSILMDV